MAQQEATLLLRIKQSGQDIMDRFVITLGDVINLAKSAFNAVMETVNAYREEQRAVNQLTQAMIQQGVFTSELRQKYLEQASALQALTTFGDDQIINAQRILQSMIGQQEVTESLTKATLDFAAAKGIDLASAAELVGKAIASDTNLLSRYGITVEQSTNSTQKLANVVDALNSKFEGQAEAAAKDLGILDQLKHQWSDFLEGVGALMGPFVMALAEATAGTLKFFNALLPEKLDLSKASINQVHLEILRLRGAILQLQDAGAARPTGMDEFEKNQVEAMERQIENLKAHQEKILEQERQAAENSLQIQRDKDARLSEMAAEKAVSEQDRIILDQQMLAMTEEQKLAAQAAYLEEQIRQEESAAQRKALVRQRAAVIEAQRDALAKKQQEQLEFAHQQAIVNIIQGAANLITAVGDANSKAVFLAQKAAALAGAIVATNLAAAQALAVPPSPNLPLASMAKTAGGLSIAAIAATTLQGLATGGIVSAQPGGAPFILGEGGRDEAVIPLPDDFDPDRGLGGGNNITIVVNGGLLGDEASAYQLAVAIDKQLYKVRQRGESVAFDEDVS